MQTLNGMWRCVWHVPGAHVGTSCGQHTLGDTCRIAESVDPAPRVDYNENPSVEHMPNSSRSAGSVGRWLVFTMQPALGSVLSSRVLDETDMEVRRPVL